MSNVTNTMGLAPSATKSAVAYAPEAAQAAAASIQGWAAPTWWPFDARLLYGLFAGVIIVCVLGYQNGWFSASSAAPAPEADATASTADAAAATPPAAAETATKETFVDAAKEVKTQPAYASLDKNDTFSTPYHRLSHDESATTTSILPAATPAPKK